ncbi:MAG: DUF2520 domain-containing protein [Bacteroidaceae bacterium]|nr:DUF2520 domain-containing protein [Bacteroidaceae bacterium]
MDIALIGRGRVATHLMDALQDAGHSVVMYGGRDGSRLAGDDVDVVIISVCDDAISSVTERIAIDRTEPLVVHTAGSVPMDVLPFRRRGVLYPMQTFSIGRDVDMSKVPFFIETAVEEDLSVLKGLANGISGIVMPLDSERRKVLHLAAVLCCNFTNHLYDLTAGVLKRNGIPFSMMLPLIDETVAKIHTMHPHDAQTGPAMRGDMAVINDHLDMIDDTYLHDIYDLMSKSIARHD